MQINLFKYLLLFVMVLTNATGSVYSQPSSLAAGAKKFSADPQLKHATWAMVVADASTGKIVFDHNGQVGLMPASTLKVLTSVSAFEMLGKTYRYKTVFGYSGVIAKQVLDGDIIIRGSGDPSLGSWRYEQAKPARILDNIIAALNRDGVKKIKGKIITDTTGWNHEAVPDGWIWQDLANYYGAGAHKINWHENQFDIFLRSPNQVGTAVEIVSTSPELKGIQLISMLRAGAKGSGDNAYVYFMPGTSSGVIRGTIPAGENRFSISGAHPLPPLQLHEELHAALDMSSIEVEENHNGVQKEELKELYIHQSPPLDSLVYWFMRKSINLYGEAFVKTIGWKNKGEASTSAGVDFIRSYWEKKGIEADAINIVDGSGLSPQNRITAMALVQSLQYARKASWYSSFYESLPVYNGMKLKSGSINGARAYAGYHKASNGKEYTISIMVNNYSGSSATVVKKMFQLLDQLK